MMRYQTKRLVIRPFLENDRENMIDLFMDDAVKQTYMLPDFASWEEAGKLFQRLMDLSQKEGRYVAGICLDGVCIGILNDTEIAGESIELGYALLPQYHNKGFCTEALLGAMEWLMDRGFREVVTGAFEENKASIRVMEKCGMERLDKVDEIEYRGKTHRCVYYARRRTTSIFDTLNKKNGGAHMKHLGTKELETNRLVLRRFTVEDAQAMYDNWASDPEVTKYLTWPTHEKVEVSAWVLGDWISHYGEAKYYQWAIVPKDNEDKPIGSVTAVRVNDKVGSVEIGYCIGKNWWHKGIMTEALGAVIQFLFEQVGVNRVSAVHDPNNPHSGGVMRKCGMTFEGTTRQSGWNNQGICDESIYAILKKDYK